MLETTLSQEVAGAEGAESGGVAGTGRGAEAKPPGIHIESDTSFQANKVPESNNNLNKGTSSRSTNRKYDRHDAGRYDDMSDDVSSASSMEHLTTARKSRRMQVDASGYNGGLSDCSHCRKHRMGKGRRSRRRKSRSRSRRRRR